jgi:hypothetical protein
LYIGSYDLNPQKLDLPGGIDETTKVPVLKDIKVILLR